MTVGKLFPAKLTKRKKCVSVTYYLTEEPFVDFFQFLSIFLASYPLLVLWWSINSLFWGKQSVLTLKMKELCNCVSVTFKLDIFLKSQPWEVRERALYNFGLPFETTDFFLEKSKPFLSKNIALFLSRWFRERHKKCHTNIFVNIETVPWHFF